MVGPISEEERDSFAARVKATVVVIVGLSTGLMAVHGDAPLPFVVGAVAVGLAVGAALVRVVFPGSGGRSPR